MRIISSHCDSALRPTSCTTIQGGSTPLDCAAHNGHLETVNILLDRGANIEAKYMVSVYSALFQQL